MVAQVSIVFAVSLSLELACELKKIFAQKNLENFWKVEDSPGEFSFTLPQHDDNSLIWNRDRFRATHML